MSLYEYFFKKNIIQYRLYLEFMIKSFFHKKKRLDILFCIKKKQFDP
jgi:hypothetical protein